MERKNIALVIGSFHKKEAEVMFKAAHEAASECSLDIVKEIWIPGTYEAPLAIKRLLMKNEIDGVAVLGIIERGETKHGLIMGQSVSDAIISLQLEFMKPVGIGIIGPEVLPEQIEPRLLNHAKGAVVAVRSMLDLPIW
ncbi:MAG: 6,7-dimethyl-8-ribityllumazine synthase [Alphaproteobacteria bacterium]|nr:6,7-dimethyl-8-ribityllumazine synthase [Alphaproteobacteria bacterium]